MAQVCDVQRILGLGKTQLTVRKNRRYGKPSAARKTSRHLPSAMISARPLSTLRPLGLGLGSLPKRKHRVCPVTCVARPMPAFGLGGLTRRMTSPLSHPKKLIDDLAGKLGASREEWSAFLPMTALFFTMAFVNTVLTSLSQTLVITAPGGGAGVIPFLTTYLGFPLTIGATILYAYASRFISHKRLFTITVGIFATCNLLFALCYPNHEVLHLHGAADTLAKFLPSGFHGAVGMVRNWTFSLFYCLSDMWGDMGISLLFWGFANDITSSKQAPIIYPLMGIGANVAQTLAGIVVKLFSNVSNAAAYTRGIQTLLFQIVGCMILVMTIHHFVANQAEQRKKQAKMSEMHVRKIPARKAEEHSQNQSLKTKLRSEGNEVERVLAQSHASPEGVYCKIRYKDYPKTFNIFGRQGQSLKVTFRKEPIHALAKMPLINMPISKRSSEEAQTSSKQKKKEDKKMSFIESVKKLTDNPVVKSLGIMTIAQALSLTLMEFAWRSHARLAYPTPAAFSALFGDIQTAIGLLAGSMMVLSPFLFKKIGWKGVANITPAVMTVGGCAFFSLCTAFHILGRLGMTHLAQQILPVIVMAGAFVYVLSRGSKYSLFKPSGEMVYIKMDEEKRTESKAAVDVVGAHLGKSGGSLLQQMLLIVSGGHLLFMTPVMFSVYIFMMRGWNGAVGTLAAFHEEKSTSEKPDVKSEPLTDIHLEDEEEDLDDEDNFETSSVAESDISFDDSKSVGSVVEFAIHSDLKDSPMTGDRIQSYPLKTSSLIQ